MPGYMLETTIYLDYLEMTKKLKDGPMLVSLWKNIRIYVVLKMLKLLRGTLLRKHVATVCMALNLSNNEVEDLANFMGHAKEIHLRHYRQPIAHRDILQVSRLLEKAQGTFDENDVISEETDEEEREEEGKIDFTIEYISNFFF